MTIREQTQVVVVLGPTPDWLEEMLRGQGLSPLDHYEARTTVWTVAAEMPQSEGFVWTFSLGEAAQTLGVSFWDLYDMIAHKEVRVGLVAGVPKVVMTPDEALVEHHRWGTGGPDDTRRN